jgi:UDP-2,3-diacylglucosamine pyrophosphatase LpxH
VHGLLKKRLGDSIAVKLGAYRFDGVHVEHGNQYFADNAYHTRRYFLKKNLPSPVVNLPWGSFFVIHLLNRVKEERPYFDKVWPMKQYYRWAFIHDTGFAVRSIARIVFYFLWLRFRKDPHRRSSIVQTIKIIKEVPLAPNLHVQAKKLLLSDTNLQVVVFGHTHGAIIRQFASDKTYINTGVWNEQISMDIANPGRIVRLTYAHLEYNESGKVLPSLKEWKGSHKIIEDVTL